MPGAADRLCFGSVRSMTSGMTIGVIGAGGIAPSHVSAWLELGVDVISFSTGGDAAQLCERFGITEVHSLPDLLAAADVVDVCTPTYTHPELVLAAAAAGRHVICEKPLALTSTQAQAMITACSEAGVHLYPAHVVRFFDAYAAAQRQVDSGGLGRIAVQRYLRMGSRPRVGWYADPALSGGIIFDLMIHDLDFARWICGDVTRVFARDTANLDDPDASVSAHVIMTHASGAVSQCTGIWRPGGPFDTRFAIAGDQGNLNHERSTYQPFRLDSVTETSDGGYVPSAQFSESPYLTEIREFLESIAGGPAPRVSAADGLAAIRLAEAATESVRTGVAVSLTAAEEGSRV